MRVKNTFVIDSDGVKERLVNNTENIKVSSKNDASEEEHHNEAGVPACKRSETRSGRTDLLTNIGLQKKQELDAHSNSTSKMYAASSSQIQYRDITSIAIFFMILIVNEILSIAHH